jgi:hypothetical protein
MMQAASFTPAKCLATLREAAVWSRVGDGKRPVSSSPSLAGVCRLSGDVRLTETAREAHRWVGVVWGGGPCTAVTPTCTVQLRARVGVEHNWGSSHDHTDPHPQSRPTLRAAGSLQGVPPSCCGRRVAVWSGACSSRPSGFGEAATTRKQPANLGVEGAEEFLTILPDYKPTVRPPPKRCRPSGPRHPTTLTCSRTATSCVRCPVCTSGALRTERGWVTAVNGAQQWI